MTENRRIEVLPVDPTRIDDFRAVHRRGAGEGWCQCVAWWVPTWDGWGSRTAEENRALRDRLFARGEFDGYLLYLAGDPVGWCQVGPARRLEKLCRSFGLDPGPDTWAITCFFVDPAFRGQGLAHALLAAVLNDLRARGCTRLLAFPRRGEGLPPDDVWTGPEPLFSAAGFVVRRDDSRRPVMEWSSESA